MSPTEENEKKWGFVLAVLNDLEGLFAYHKKWESAR